MNIKIKEIDDFVVISLNGNLVEEPNTNEFNSIVREQISCNKKNIIVDLGEIEFTNSTGLSVLFRGYKAVEEAGGKFMLVNLSTKLTHLLSITKLNTLFVIEKNVETAIKKLS
jgi:anti-sigma B factor antagonist